MKKPWGPWTITLLVVLAILFLVQTNWGWIEVHTGTVHETGPYYGWWSGFASIMERVVELLVIGVILLRHHNCHATGCPWLGKHEYKDEHGQVWKYCRKCHPDLKVRNGPGKRHEVHERHRRRVAAEAEASPPPAS